MESKHRYHWLMVDGKRIHLITMEEKRTRRGNKFYELPEEFTEYLEFQGIEIVPAANKDAAEWFSNRLQMREKQFGALANRPDDHEDWFCAHPKAKQEGIENENNDNCKLQ